jgi:WD40 repeat protein
MNHFRQVLLLALVLGSGAAGLWPSGSAAVAADGPQSRVLYNVPRDHSKAVSSVAYSPDGKTLASASLDKTIKLWAVATGVEQATIKGHTHFVLSVAFSPDDKTLASGSFDKTVRLWDAATGKERAALKGHTGWVYSVAFSPDSKALASASQDGTVRLWDAATGK